MPFQKEVLVAVIHAKTRYLPSLLQHRIESGVVRLPCIARRLASVPRPKGHQTARDHQRLIFPSASVVCRATARQCQAAYDAKKHEIFFHSNVLLRTIGRAHLHPHDSRSDVNVCAYSLERAGTTFGNAAAAANKRDQRLSSMKTQSDEYCRKCFSKLETQRCVLRWTSSSR